MSNASNTILLNSLLIGTLLTFGAIGAEGDKTEKEDGLKGVDAELAARLINDELDERERENEVKRASLRRNFTIDLDNKPVDSVFKLLKNARKFSGREIIKVKLTIDNATKQEYDFIINEIISNKLGQYLDERVFNVFYRTDTEHYKRNNTLRQPVMNLAYDKDKSGDTPWDKSGDTPWDKSGDTPWDKSGDTPWDKSGDTPWDKSGDTPWDKSGDTPWDKSGDTPWDKSGDTTWDKSGDTPWEKHNGIKGNRVGENGDRHNRNGRRSIRGEVLADANPRARETRAVSNLFQNLGLRISSDLNSNKIPFTGIMDNIKKPETVHWSSSVVRAEKNNESNSSNYVSSGISPKHTAHPLVSVFCRKDQLEFADQGVQR